VFDILPIFDHLTLNARDELAPCCEALEAMGFLLTPASYSNIGAVNRCIVLEGAYLEAIAVDPQAISPRLELLQQPLGLNAIVLRTDDADACYADLIARGFPVLPVQPFSRLAKNSLGEEREVSFRVVRFESSWGAEAFLFGRVYFCQHLNPEVVFDPGYVRHDNSCRAFESLAIEVRNLEKLSEVMKRLFGVAWSSAGTQASLKTQNLDIRFTQSLRDCIGTCGFTKRARAPVQKNHFSGNSLSQPHALTKHLSPQVFENPYGRFSF
jgi:Glyoxalase-like domain